MLSLLPHSLLDKTQPAPVGLEPTPLSLLFSCPSSLPAKPGIQTIGWGQPWLNSKYCDSKPVSLNTIASDHCVPALHSGVLCPSPGKMPSDVAGYLEVSDLSQHSVKYIPVPR